MGSGRGLERKQLFPAQQGEYSVKRCVKALRYILKRLYAGLALHFNYVVVVLCKILLVRLKDISRRRFVVYPYLIAVVYPVQPVVLIVGQKTFIVVLRKPVLLYSKRQKTALIAPELLRKRCALVMLKVIPYRTHPQLLHIRSYARAAECAHKALEALILKCRPPFFARDNDGLTLLLKPFYKKAVERIAVRDRRQVGVCVDRVDDKTVFR